MITQIKGKNKLAYIWNKTRIVIEFYSTLIIASVLFFVAELSQPYLLHLLSSSRTTPWGVVTSIFVHWPFEHLLLNIAGIGVSTFLLIEIVLFNSETNPIKVSWFFCLCPFVSGVAANILFLAFLPKSTSYGASGVLYAMEGVLIFASLLSIFRTMSYVKVRTYFFRRRYQLHFLYHIFIFLFYFLQIIFYPSLFLNVQQGVNVFTHSVSLLLGLFATLLYYNLRR